MSTESITDLRERFSKPPRFAETLKFVTTEHEEITAYDLISSLVGVTLALDYGVTPTNEDRDRDVAEGLVTAARLLAEQLRARLDFDSKPRRREGAR